MQKEIAREMMRKNSPMMKQAATIKKLTEENQRLQTWIDLHRGDTMSLSNEVDRFRDHNQYLEKVLDDNRRLTRELDIALHGEDGAAKQASLCDLIEPARQFRARVMGLEKERYKLITDLADMKDRALRAEKQLNERCLNHISDVLEEEEETRG